MASKTKEELEDFLKKELRKARVELTDSLAGLLANLYVAGYIVGKYEAQKETNNG